MPEHPSRFARHAVQVEEAQRRILQRVRTLPLEDVPLAAAVGRRLGEPFDAPEDVPQFRRSGLDGFAVRSADSAAASPLDPAVLRVIGVSAAGCEAPPQVEPGTAVRVMTGAPVPEGADAVVMFEQTDAFEATRAERPDGTVRIRHPVRAGQNVAAPGDDLRRGEPLLARGIGIVPGHVGVLSACGVQRLRVFRRPVVGILCTGSELVGAGEPLRPAQVRNSNAPMLAAQTAAAGGVPHLLGIAPDDSAEVRRVVRLALAACDLVVTTGGVSVGDHDVMAEWFRSVPADTTDATADCLLFNKVAIRPGSPTSAAIVCAKLMIGLSGNPGACFVGFELFVRPALLAMQGKASPFEWLLATSDADYSKGSPHDRYERARMFHREGRLYVRPLGGKSGMMRSLLEANALMIIPSGPDGLLRGQSVRVVPLGASAAPDCTIYETE